MHIHRIGDVTVVNDYAEVNERGHNQRAVLLPEESPCRQ